MPRLIAIDPPRSADHKASLRPHIIRRRRGRWVVPLSEYHKIYPPRLMGLGDVVAIIARWIRADRLANLYERKTGKSCGCARRQEKLNRWFPFK